MNLVLVIFVIILTVLHILIMVDHKAGYVPDVTGLIVLT